MSIRLKYESGKSATYTDITDRLRLYTLDLTQDAEEGSVALSSVTIDDPAGDYDIIGWRRMYFVESDAAGSNTVLYNGYTGDRTVERGPYRTGPGRVFKVSLADSNAVAQWRVMTQTAANRPAETDVARVQWLMTTNEMERITQTIYLSTANPIAMDAVDYRGQRGSDVLDDCAQASGKNYFVHTTETSGVGDVGLSLWYGDSGLAVYSSPIRLTNILSDITADPYGMTFALSDDTTLVRDPSRVYSGAYIQYDGGTSYTEDFTISNNFTRRDAVVPAENVKTNAKATARGVRYLADMSTEEDRITTSYLVPNAKINFVREGMRLQIRAAHLPGYESFVWARVLKRTLKQVGELEYLVTLELTVTPAAAVAGNILVAYITLSQTSVGSAPTDQSTNGWTKAFWSGDFADATQSPGPGVAQAMGMWYRAVVPGEAAAVLKFGGINPGTNAAWVFQVSGASLSGLTSSQTNNTLTWAGNPTASTVASPSASVDSVWIGGFSLQKVNYGQVTLITATNGTQLINANANNETGGTCTVTADGATPRTWIGYRTGTGSLTIGGNITCSGASPDYNLYGRGRGGLLMPLSGTFSVVQQAHEHVLTSGSLIVTLPAAP